MKTLLLMRHAKSSWDHAGLTDHERPLNKRGQKAAPLMGRLLKEKDLVPEIIISSTAVRAQETAALVQEASEYTGKIQSIADIYEAAPSTYIKIIKTIENQYQRVLVIGHNPGMESLVTKLTGLYERFPTAAIAHLELPIDHWTDLKNATKTKMVDLFRPKEL